MVINVSKFKIFPYLWNSFILCLGWFAIAALALPQDALAQAINDLPTLDDLSKADGDSTALRIFSSLFGKDFVASPLTQIGGASGLLGSLFFVFNGVLFVVGTGFILYNTVMMIAVSAHKGEVLGERMSSLWIPIRLGTGIFGMAPVFMGFSLAQAIMFMIAIIGNNLGDMMARTAIEMNDEFNVIVPAPGLSAAQTPHLINQAVVDSLFAMHVCQMTYDKYQSQIDGEIWSDITNTIGAVTTWMGITKGSGKPTILYDKNGGIAVGNVNIVCGGIRVADETTPRKSSSSGYRNPAVNYEEINAQTKAIFEARKKLLRETDAAVRAQAEYWAYPILKDEPSYLYPSKELMDIAENAAKKETDFVQSHLKKVLGDGDDSATGGRRSSAIAEAAKKKMIEGGWMTLGSWYATFAESNAAVQAAAVGARFDPIPMDFKGKKLPEEVSLIFEKLGQQKADSDQASCLVGEANEVGRCSWGQNILRGALEAAVGNSAGAEMVNPIIASKNLGDWMLVGVGSTISIGFIAKVAALSADSLKGVPLAGEAGAAAAKVAALLSFKTASAVVNPFSAALSVFIGSPIWGAVLTMSLVLGIVLAVYIPLVPFITWFTASISYFASVVEGMIAAQIWAFSHLHTDGEGMGQRTERGYVYMLNMLLRPALMIFGFFFASAILVLLGTFFFNQIGPAVANMQGNTNTGPLIFFGLTVVFMIVILSLVQTVFNMIYEVPDRVIAWFGHGMEARMAQNMDREIDAKTGRAAAWAGGALLSQGKGAQGLMRQPKSQRDRGSDGKQGDSAR